MFGSKVVALGWGKGVSDGDLNLELLSWSAGGIGTRKVPCFRVAEFHSFMKVGGAGE